jgi:beta-glucosidase
MKEIGQKGLGMLLNVAAVCGLQVGAPACAQQPRVPVATGDARVDGLLHRMTLDEKIQLLHGTGEDAETNQGEAGYVGGIPRLGIPSLRFADGPPGVLTRVPAAAPTATTGLAATFSSVDAQENGELIASQAKSRGIDVVLQPFINIDRDFQWSRGYNTYGEDPLLTGTIGSAFIRGVQRKGVMAQAKHYVGYDADSADIEVDPQTLHEIYLTPFAEAVHAGVSSIMCSYNKINGVYSCGDGETLNAILRDELGFKGFVTSDWGATHGTVFIKDGLDMEMPGRLPVSWADPQFFYDSPSPPASSGATDEKYPDAMPEGLPEEQPRSRMIWPKGPKPTTSLKAMVTARTLSEATIDQAAGRVLYEMDRFGLLDHAPSHEIKPDETETNARVIRKTGQDSAVLLKNEGVLPLNPDELGSTVLIGPGGRQTVAVGQTGEKAVELPEREIGTLHALEQYTADTTMSFAVADDMDGEAIPASYLSHDGIAGLQKIVPNGQGQVDAQINFTKKNGKALPANTTATWKGTLNIPSSGSYRMHLQVLGCYSNLIIDGKRVSRVGLMWIHGDISQAGQDNILPTTDGLDNDRVALDLAAGPHSVMVEVTPDSSNNPAQVRLPWVTPEQQRANYTEAIEAAKNAKTAIVFAWSRGYPYFALPGDQNQLISAVAAVNRNTIVVLNVSQPVAMPWLDKVKGVLQMWWPGAEGGWATADVLLGRVIPAGRLPFTWPRRGQDMPAEDPAHPERSNLGGDGRTTYSEGIYVGYRCFDHEQIEPLFPFGFGLSYTRFAYSGLKAEPSPDGGMDVSFEVTNSGPLACDEVPQVYLSAPNAPPQGSQFAVRALAGFERVHLNTGEVRTVSLHLAQRRFQYWSEGQGRWEMGWGGRTLYVGASSRDLRLKIPIILRRTTAVLAEGSGSR